MNKTGPWKLTEKLSGGTDVQIQATTDPRWVVKVSKRYDAATELSTILRFWGNPPRHSVHIPHDLGSLFGHGTDEIWYAMRRYDGHLEVDDFTRQHWLQVGNHCLEFLQDLHLKHGLLHMDIKSTNILVNRSATQFVVADYETVARPNGTTPANESRDYRWYHLRFGAVPDQPVYSWRYDLTALGYLLADLTWPDGEPPWNYRGECDGRRGSGYVSVFTDADVILLRDEAFTKAHPTVRAYLDAVATLPWDARDPPPATFYEQLLALFH